MSAKDAFFQKVEENIDAQKSSQDALKTEIVAFQEGTSALIQEIKTWFDGSPIEAAIGGATLEAEGVRFTASTLRLQNAEKILTIVPEGLHYFGVTGVLKVTLDIPSRTPRRTEFSIHWKDSVSKLSGWVMVDKPVVNAPVQRGEFNQESFFRRISSFA